MAEAKQYETIVEVEVRKVRAETEKKAGLLRAKMENEARQMKAELVNEISQYPKQIEIGEKKTTRNKEELLDNHCVFMDFNFVCIVHVHLWIHFQKSQCWQNRPCDVDLRVPIMVEVVELAVVFCCDFVLYL